MLLNDFFTIQTVDGEASFRAGGDSSQWKADSAGREHTFKVGLELNAGHRIFEGHFPGQPVVPGVCLMQMVKEVCETVLVKELRLQRADHCKFIAIIEPNEGNILEMTLAIRIKEDEQVTVSASLLNNAAVCFKFSGVFRILGA